MKVIMFVKFDFNGNYKGEAMSERKYTFRGAMEHLRANGFEPTNKTRKLCKTWTNGKGCNAYILNW